ncbi:MAG TPA: M28 family metallopeptidase [Phenylobacterium sp.]|jgi:Zn-dependent M28 family amino/carboxypeptidase|uniref:M28 family metallopeptidase n=1 Tax=Phenylobacterium sp. TaxID=1871053 RepID=UPI002D4F9A7E|nr:M28 family metallopeptidase [Phenylobacterium sp.]HZZ68190.1 M28 family metallopeptidase [Phenylobacterium sp.]
MKKLLLGVAACALATAAFAAPAEPKIDPALLSEHIKVLSSDAFEGRGPATPGEVKSVAYIEKEFKAVGLQPGGDKLKSGARAWTQDVPLAEFDIKGPVAFTVQAGGKTESWKQGDQIAIRAPETGVDHIDLKNVPVVFVGYGVKAPERNWDDFKGVDLHGKIALVLVNDPDYETGKGDFGGKAMTYYGRWTYKYEEAARQGALGFIVIHETGPASYGWNTVKNSNTNAVFDIIRKEPSKVHAPIEAWIQRDPTVALFQSAGLDFEALKKEAQTRAFKPVTLSGVSFSTAFKVDAKKVVSHNVVGVLPGTKHPGERLIYTAHWDHLGVGLPDARGDRIYNGAVDNASGVSALIELARAFAHGPRTERTQMFMAVTAEEKGLLGSEYYATNPLYPLATTVADINMDGAAVNGPAKDISTSGDAGLTLQDDLIKVAKAHGRYFTPDARPEAGSFFRSDHFSFAKQGLPALSFRSGEDLVKGGVAAGKAAGEAYVRDKYHQPADEFDPNWDLSGMVQDVALVYDLGHQLGDSREWPEWKPGSEFKAARDKTAAQRK